MVQKWKKGHFSVLGEESKKSENEPIFHFGSHLEPSGAPPLFWEPSGRRLGEVWETAGETAGRRRGGVWKASGRRAGAAWERFAGRLGDVWAHTGGRSWRRRRAPGEESRGGGGAGWGSRRCGSGQPAVPAGGISPLSRVGASARQGRRSFRFTPIPAGGLLVCILVCHSVVLLYVPFLLCLHLQY